MKYALKRADGGVMIMTTARDDADPEAEIAKWHPKLQARLAQPLSIREVTDADIPEDREYRDAWEDDGSKIVHNVTKAKAIFDERVRAHKLAKARRLRAREDIGEDVTAERAALQAVKPDAAKAASVDELKTLWPKELAR